MEILDKVYSAFKNLDRDYARSKKTRTDFITDKFGGDIDIGSVIILDAATADASDTDPEDVKKLSFIKDIFENIKNSRNALERLPDFSFKNTGLFTELTQVIAEAEYRGMRTRAVSQLVLAKKEPETVHFRCTAARSEYAPLNKCTIYHAYNQNMEEYIMAAFGKRVKLETGSFYKVAGKTGVMKVSAGSLVRSLSSDK